MDLARVRTSASATPRSKGQLSHADVLSRYRPGSTSAITPASPGGATSTTGDGSQATSRISAARRDAAARSAAARTAAAREKKASQNAARTQAARASAADQATEQRVREAREKAALEASTADQTRARVEAARRDKAASNDARTQAAREQYSQRVRAAREAAATGGGPAVAGGVTTTSIGGDWGNDNYSSCGYYDSCYWNTWGSCWSLGWCNWWCGPTYCCGLWWHSYWYAGGAWCYPWNFYWYGPFIPSSYTVVYQDVEPEVIYIEVPAVEAGEAVVPAAAPAFVPPTESDPSIVRELNRATSYYLTQGDRAFREARYGDAAHFYAKALEYSPDSGILYLVLADALFATGDYRYAAFAIRKALELEPELASNVIDKRDFYAVALDFDRQLATLERFVEDHVIDDDARLVLATNYLFGGRPAAAVALFQSPFSENLAKSPTGQLILEAARSAQFGEAGPDAVEAPAAEGMDTAPVGAEQQ